MLSGKLWEMKEISQKEMASMGGKARATKLTKARKLEIAKRAANKRWKK